MKNEKKYIRNRKGLMGELNCPQETGLNKCGNQFNQSPVEDNQRIRISAEIYLKPYTLGEIGCFNKPNNPLLSNIPQEINYNSNHPRIKWFKEKYGESYLKLK